MCKTDYIDRMLYVNRSYSSVTKKVLWKEDTSTMKRRQIKSTIETRQKVLWKEDSSDQNYAPATRVFYCFTLLFAFILLLLASTTTTLGCECSRLNN